MCLFKSYYSFSLQFLNETTKIEITEEMLRYFIRGTTKPKIRIISVKQEEKLKPGIEIKNCKSAKK